MSEPIKDGNDLALRTGGDLEAMWDLYSEWVLGRVHFERALVQPKDTADQYPFDVLMADLGSRGFAAEAAEVLDEHKKLLYHGSDYAIKRAKIVEELGDSIWYLIPTMKAHGITLGEVILRNVDKLVAKDGVNGERFGDRAKNGG